MYSRFDPEARIAVMQATEEARELGHSEVGPDHVLLGLLSNMRGSTFALLTEHGLRLDSAREVVVAQRAALAETQPSPTGTPDSDVSDADPTAPDSTPASTRTARRSVPSASTSTRSARPSGPRSVTTSPSSGVSARTAVGAEVSAAAGTTAVGAEAGADHEAGSSPTVASSRTR